MSLCLDLGLVNVAVLRTSLHRGALAGTAVGIGSCVGDMVYFSLATLGVAALLTWSPFRWAVWVGGTGILLVLAWRMGREVLHPHELRLAAPTDTAVRGLGRLVLYGVSLALASPTAILWFAAVGGSVIASAGGDRAQLTAFAAGFFIAGVLWAIALPLATSLLARATGGRLVRAMSLASAALFLYFAVAVFLRGLAELVQGRPALPA